MGPGPADAAKTQCTDLAAALRRRPPAGAHAGAAAGEGAQAVSDLECGDSSPLWIVWVCGLSPWRDRQGFPRASANQTETAKAGMNPRTPNYFPPPDKS